MPASAQNALTQRIKLDKSVFWTTSPRSTTTDRALQFKQIIFERRVNAAPFTLVEGLVD